MADSNTPGFFPGYAPLLQHASVRVTASDLQKLRSDVAADITAMDHGFDSVFATIEHRYHGDPLVMRLLALYETTHFALKELNASVSAKKVDTEDAAKPWLEQVQ